MNKEEMEKYNFWTTGNDDIWVMESYCLTPSCRLRNLEAGKIKDFGLGGITAQEFKPIKIGGSWVEEKLVKIFRMWRHLGE